ncbi:hypothetical protein COL922a_010583 [Colletotrichum nupharicola]|nr:hypothetical protein COL922a_010583 [Colletotrichum nupharicola]
MSLKSLTVLAGILSVSAGSFLQSDEYQVPLVSGSSRRPNIVFILTDDQDLHMNSLDYVPFIKKHLIDQGTLYKRHFCGYPKSHSNVQSNVISNGSVHDPHGIVATPPIPAERHAHLFPDAIVPRTDNLNPEKVSGASWVRQQPRQSAENIAFNDHFYRNRLRALQAVDELVDSVVSRLEEYGILEETYIFYTTDNGYHIGHHRLQPGKECGYEEDINIPLIFRGPLVPEGKVAEIVTTHQDLVPTIMSLAQAPLRADFDGLAIPLTEEDFGDAAKTRHEHVTVEYWGFAASEGPWGYFGRNESFVFNNTYKALRVVSKEYNLYYSVWCNNEHELYDLNVPFAHILGAHCIRKAMWTLCATHFHRDSTVSISNGKISHMKVKEVRTGQ